MEFKLLVVEDEPTVLAAFSEFFAERGYRVLQAASGDEALAMVRREAVDLVVLDLRMPGLPGEETLRVLRKSAPKTKVVVVTGYPEREAEVRAIGCDGFFVKPLAVEKLVQRVAALLEDKERDEIRELVMGNQIGQAAPGQPVAQLLFFEPGLTLGRILEEFFSDPSRAGGTYKVHVAGDPEQALGLMLAARPDIVLLDLGGGQGSAAGLVRQFLKCEFQPKDYILYQPPHLRGERDTPDPLPAKRWEGNPFREEGLNELARLVHRTAIEHGLVKK